MKDNCENKIVKGAFYIASKRSGSIPQGYLVRVEDVVDERINVNIGAYALTIDEFLDTFHDAPVESVKIRGELFKPFSCNEAMVFLDRCDKKTPRTLLLKQKIFACLYNPPYCKTYYTLRSDDSLKAHAVMDEDGNEVIYETYEEAYDAMCNIYINSLQGKHFSCAKSPVRPVIMRTTVSSFNGQVNSCTCKA